MIDSTNPRQLADNIRKLWDKFKSISGDLLPSRSTATTGQILKLTGENKTPNWSDEYSYTPPAFSETEVNTGQKWIDGKEIYTKVFEFTTNSSSGPKNVGSIANIEKLINTTTVLTTSLSFQISSYNSYTYVDSAGNVVNIASTEGSQNVSAIAILNYTKTDPVPATRDDDTPEEPEVKETKTTRKKTTK